MHRLRRLWKARQAVLTVRALFADGAAFDGWVERWYQRLDQELGPAERYFGVENPKGELGFFVDGDGTGRPRRMRIRGPSFMSIASFPYALKGAMLADVVAILGSFDFVMGECDR